jgi:protein-S-isoprenylcysteine O-methyltransferase Ste14
MLSNHKLMFAIMVVVLAAILWDAHSGPVSGWQIAGAAIAIPALAMWFIARLELGRSFSVSAQARQLVTTGIYSKIRNPIYVFGALFILGVLLYMQRFWWLLVFAVLIPMQMVRARKEAQVLEAVFGEKYREYRANTWF